MSSANEIDEPDSDIVSCSNTLDESDAEPVSTTRASLRRWGWIPMLAVSLGLVGAAWSLSSPIGSSPDDDFHLGSLWCSEFAPDDLCEPSQQDLSLLDPEILATVGNGTRLVRVPARVGQEALCFAFDATASAACQNTISDTEFGETRANDGLYPGGYYQIMGPLVSASEGRSVLLIRVATFLVSLSLITGAAVIATPHVRRAYILAVLLCSIPLGLFFFASTNPSGLAIAGVGAAFTSALSFLRSSSTREVAVTGAFGLAATLVAIMSRADAGLYIASAFCCAIILEKGWQKTLLRRSIGVSVVAAGSLISIALSGQTSSATDGIGVSDGALPLGTVLWNNILNLPSLWAGSIGIGWGLGWLDTRMPDAVGTGMLLAAGGLLLWGLGDVRRVKLLAVGLALLTVTAVPMWLLAADRRLVGELLQPRYLLPMLVVVCTSCLVPARDFRRGFNLTQLVSLGTIFSVAHSISLHSNIRRYVTGQDVRSPNLNANVEWWWPISITPMAVWLIGSAAFSAVVVIALVKCVLAYDGVQATPGRSRTSLSTSTPQDYPAPASPSL